jgi:hypothetical protein
MGAGHGTRLAGTGTQRSPTLAPNEPQKNHRQKMPGARLILIFDRLPVKFRRLSICRPRWGRLAKSDALGGG